MTSSRSNAPHKGHRQRLKDKAHALKEASALKASSHRQRFADKMNAGKASFHKTNAHQRGIDLIDRFLQPDSKFLHLMTDDDLDGMREIRTLLAMAKQKREHAPAADVVPEDTSVGMPDFDGHVSEYIKHEFGFKVKMSVKKIGKHIRKGYRLSDRGSMIQSQRDFLCEKMYVPEEFLALDQGEKEEVRNMLDCENLKLWAYDAQKTAPATKGNPILFIGWAILGAPHAQKAMAGCLGVKPPAWVDSLTSPNRFEFLETFNISPKVLCNFLRAVESRYNKENPYHNNIHAADVLQTTYSLLKMGGDEYAGGTLDIFSLLVAAACHDIGHPGLNNLYQKNTRSELAIVYNDESILENMHASTTFQVLHGSPAAMNLDITSGLNRNQYQAFRAIVIESILYTDMSKHFTQVKNLKQIVADFGTENRSKYFMEKDQSISQALLFFLHSADISNSAKPDPVFRQWAERVLAEFFAQGDREREKGMTISALCDRYEVDLCESQIGFVKFVILPNFLLLADMIPAVGEKVVPILQENLAYWEKRKEKEDNERAYWEERKETEDNGQGVSKEQEETEVNEGGLS